MGPGAPSGRGTWSRTPSESRPQNTVTERGPGMTFIETVAAGDATGATAELYAAEEEVFGFLPNLVQAFSLRPEVYFAWKQLNGAVKGGMDLRRYELATIAAARELRSSYCMLAHGSVLMD